MSKSVSASSTMGSDGVIHPSQKRGSGSIQHLTAACLYVLGSTALIFTARQHFEIPSRRVSIPAERHDFLSQVTHSTSTFAYVHSSNATSFSAESHFKIMNSLLPHPWNAVDFAARPHSQLRNPYNHPNRTPRCFQSTKISPFQGFATPRMSIRQSAMTTSVPHIHLGLS